MISSFKRGSSFPALILIGFLSGAAFFATRSTAEEARVVPPPAVDEQASGKTSEVAVTSARGRSRGRNANSLDRFFQAGDDPLIASESVGFLRPDEARADAPRGGDGVHPRFDVGDRRGSVRVRRGSYVDGKLHMTGNDVGRAGPGFETSDSRHEITVRDGPDLRSRASSRRLQ